MSKCCIKFELFSWLDMQTVDSHRGIYIIIIGDIIDCKIMASLIRAWRLALLDDLKVTKWSFWPHRSMFWWAGPHFVCVLIQGHTRMHMYAQKSVVMPFDNWYAPAKLREKTNIHVTIDICNAGYKISKVTALQIRRKCIKPVCWASRTNWVLMRNCR